MNTQVFRRSIVGLVLFLAVVAAGCAPLPPPVPQQDVQKLQEQIATLETRIEELQAAPPPEAASQADVQALQEQIAALEARIEELQAAPMPGEAGKDEMMAQMADLQERMEEMMQRGSPDPEALAEMQQQMRAFQQQMQQMMTMLQEMLQMMPDSEIRAKMQHEMEAMQQQMEAMQRMIGGMGMGMGMGAGVSSTDFVPPVKGLYAGEEILFIHTEASDPDVANMLTVMMGPLVVVMPRLAEVPESLLANVYVFTNGIEGAGPFGFQPDVFDAVPGDEGYSPLRAINLVTWQEGATARELRSVEEVKEAESKGEVTIQRPGIVVNMPILTWPGGHR